MLEINAKSDLRRKIRSALEKISPAVRAVESIELCDRLAPQLQSAHQILFFAPLPDEPDIWPLLEKCVAAGKICALPAFDAVTQVYSARRVTDPSRDIVTGKFGVREPAAGCEEIPLEQFNVVLVPGMAFDVRGTRLGRGRGFYDRLLAKISGIKCGISHDFQLLTEILVEPHDVKVDFIFTPARGVRRPR